jgi:hypothetical protein
MTLAHMLVPKMAKNGFDFVASAWSFLEAWVPMEIRNKREDQKRKKNHFRPISEQPCALKR